jgi:hypothetical protein
MQMAIVGMSWRLCSPCAANICRAPWSRSSRTSASLLRRMSLTLALLLCQRTPRVRECQRRSRGESRQALRGEVTDVAARRRSRRGGMKRCTLRVQIALPPTVQWHPTGLRLEQRRPSIERGRSSTVSWGRRRRRRKEHGGGRGSSSSSRSSCSSCSSEHGGAARSWDDTVRRLRKEVPQHCRAIARGDASRLITSSILPPKLSTLCYAHAAHRQP